MRTQFLMVILGTAFGLMTTSISFARSTAEVWQHHIDAWEARDLDDIVSDYSENSILILNSEVFRGKSKIRDVFARLFEIFDDGSNRIDPVILDGRTVYITWHFTPDSATEEFFGTDTFIIEDAKISVQTIASPLYDQYPVE